MEHLAEILGAIVLIIVIAILFAFPVMWLWNWLMPVIFGLTKITVWQALGLMILCQFLFKNTNSSNKD